MGDSGAIVSSGHAKNGSKTGQGETLKHPATLTSQQSAENNSAACCVHAFLCFFPVSLSLPFLRIVCVARMDVFTWMWVPKHGHVCLCICCGDRKPSSTVLRLDY